jgi:hypothetical protein
MKWLGSRVLWGLLLIAGGILFFLQNLHLITFGNIIWAIIIGLGGVFFLSIFFENRANWWSLIPGITLLSIAVIILLGILLPSLAGEVSGAVFLGGVGLSFWLIYFLNRGYWWAIIPGGVLFTLAAVTVVGALGSPMDTGGIFFLGLSLTFLLLGVLPGYEKTLRWAFIPGGILLVMSLIILASSASLINYIWPVLLILGGLFLVFRTMARH